MEFRDGQLHTYLGDVEFFLEKRELDDMRKVEMTEKKAAKSAVVQESTKEPVVELSYEERKRLVRLVSNAEKKIERLESDISKLQEKMYDPVVAVSAEAAEIGKKLKEKQQEIEKVMSEWEEAQELLDQAG